MEAHPSCPGGWLPKSIGSRGVAGKEKNTSPCSASETCAWVTSCWSKGRIGRTPGGFCNLMIFLGLNESFHLISCFQEASTPGFPQVWWWAFHLTLSSYFHMVCPCCHLKKNAGFLVGQVSGLSHLPSFFHCEKWDYPAISILGRRCTDLLLPNIFTLTHSNLYSEKRYSNFPFPSHPFAQVTLVTLRTT